MELKDIKFPAFNLIPTELQECKERSKKLILDPNICAWGEKLTITTFIFRVFWYYIPHSFFLSKYSKKMVCCHLAESFCLVKKQFFENKSCLLGFVFFFIIFAGLKEIAFIDCQQNFKDFSSSRRCLLQVC